MRVRDLLQLPIFGGTAVVAGASGLDRIVRWAHVVDVPNPAPWIAEGHLLLTTGYAWPREPASEEAQLDALAARGAAAVALAVPHYLARFSVAATARAERLGLPLLEIPWELPFARITEDVHRELLTAQQNSIARSEEIHRSLTLAATEATTLHDLAQRLGELIDRAVAIDDAQGNLLGAYGRAANEGGIADGGADRGEPERRGVACAIRVGGELAGFVRVLADRATLSDLDQRAAEHAALVAAVQIAHQRELAYLESRLGYASFISLLEAPNTTPQTLERAQLLGFDPAVAYRVGIAILDEPLPLGRDGVLRRDALLERLRRHLIASGVARPMLGASLDRIPFLVPEDLDPAGIAAALDDDAARLVFGRAASGTDGVRASYCEARELLGYDGIGRVARYEDVLVPRVLLGDARARDAFVRDLFGPLAGAKGERAMRDALLRFADEGFAFRRTASALAIHPNTLRYRLDRAAALTGLALDDPDVRFRLQLAARLLRLSANASDTPHKIAHEN
jgi:purine catabolism regulator